MNAIALNAISEIGARDRLSLVAQFAAHQAFLQFAGVSDGPFDLHEWAVARKRGQDCRLIRVAAAGGESGMPLSFSTAIEDFARAITAPPLDTLRQPWWRAEAVYAEVAVRLRSDVAADLRWMRSAAAGEVVAPGASALRQIWMQRAGRHVYRDSIVAESLAALAAVDDSVRVAFIGTSFPARRYSALESLDASLMSAVANEAEIAQRVSALLESKRTIVVVRPDEQLDPASRSVIDIASQLGTATWLTHGAEDSLGGSRFFALSPRVAAQSQLEARLRSEAEPRRWLHAFVASPVYDRYLDAGKLPPVSSDFMSVPEPKRSLIAAIALLGISVPREVAARFVREFLIDQPLEQLTVPGVCELDDHNFFFASDDVRNECAAHIPAASQPALFRAAAALCEPRHAALLLFDAGEKDRAFELLDRVMWSSSQEIVSTLLPLRSLPPALAASLATALIECGRYREAAEVENAGDAIQAHVERRRGEYITALARLEPMTARDFNAQRLLCELLRLAHRHEEAAAAASSLRPRTAEEARRKSYESALIALECGAARDVSWLVPRDYYSLRFETYRALRADDFDTAATLAADAVAAARSTIDRIDAWLDRVFTSFSAGRWSETRALALEALVVIDEAPGDRAAAAILYTLAYLAADDAQWRIAEHLISRLRQHYCGSDRDERLAETNLLDAHLDFCRGRFTEAHRRATAVLEGTHLAPQIREAAALIVDEVDWMRGLETPLRSRGDSGNRELMRRRSILVNRRSGARIDLEHTAPASRSEKLHLFRAALAAGRDDVAKALATELDLTFERAPKAPAGDELTVLAIAATAEFPYPVDVFGDRRWCFASRNRLGHWNLTGSIGVASEELDRIVTAGDADWIGVSDRELLFFEGIGKWSDISRRALCSTFALHAEAARLRRLVDNGDAEPARKTTAHDIVGESTSIRAVFQLIDRVAKRDVPVCILGESGTGKELVARAIQHASSRRAKPFMPVNCAALPETLIESELFGHVRGAFTGADRDRAGLIETTDGGTLFLDEVGELPLVAQAKLLRFLQDGEFRRVGEAVSRSADVRIISATNRKLESAVENGSFREDLYYRLRGVEIDLPPLRERGNDVLLLAAHFLAAERTKHRSGPVALSSEVESVFRVYRWPGNVRELQNTIRAAHAMAGDCREVELEHLPARVRNCVVVRTTGASSYQDAVMRFRRDLIEKSLLEAAGNQNRAAALLNISRQALAYQIRELGILVKKAPRPRL